MKESFDVDRRFQGDRFLARIGPYQDRTFEGARDIDELIISTKNRIPRTKTAIIEITERAMR